MLLHSVSGSQLILRNDQRNDRPQRTGQHRVGETHDSLKTKPIATFKVKKMHNCFTLLTHHSNEGVDEGERKSGVTGEREHAPSEDPEHVATCFVDGEPEHW